MGVWDPFSRGLQPVISAFTADRAGTATIRVPYCALQLILEKYKITEQEEAFHPELLL